MRARWLVATAILMGAAVGLAAFTFVYARGYSYLTNDPAACANCHVMSEHYAAWEASSHHTVATCNDCHTPHALVPKYWVKSRNGFWHSFYFTTGRYPYPLAITPPNHDVVEAACRGCHDRLVVAMNAGIEPHGSAGDERQAVACTHCHRTVGHWVR